MKWDEHGIKTPLARARGLGSAHSGQEHWWAERVTSIAALPLMLWLAWSAMQVQDWGYDAFTAWLAAPVNAILMVLVILVMFYHAALGARVIVEDYINHEGFKLFKLVGIKLYFFAAGVACLFSILKIAFAG